MRPLALPEPPALAFAETARGVLSAAGYTAERVVERIGGNAIGPREHPRILRATREGTPLDTLIRLFVLSVPVAESAARAAFAPSALEAWVDAGIVACRKGRVLACFALAAEVGAWIVSDLRGYSGQRDYVVGLGRSSVLGIRATPRTRVERVLEIGAGSGGSTVLLGRHAAQVVSTDVNPRALAIAAFNARLNDASNLAFRSGSLFEPVAGEQFDLIVSNPPFAIGPSSGLTYREGGFPLDGFVERIVRGAPAHLRSGAVCVLTANWAELSGVDWRDRLASWAHESQSDVLFVRMSSVGVEHYVTSWLGETLLRGRAAQHGAWQRWVSHLEAARVCSVGAGLVVLRRTGQPARTWFLDGVEEVDAGGGGALLRALDDFARLAAADEAALLAARPRVPSGIRVEQSLELRDQGWEGGSVVLRRLAGLQLAIRADARVATVLLRSDGVRNVAEVAREVAREFGTHADEVARETPRIVRRLVEHGLLTLA